MSRGGQVSITYLLIPSLYHPNQWRLMKTQLSLSELLFDCVYSLCLLSSCYSVDVILVLVFSVESLWDLFCNCFPMLWYEALNSVFFQPMLFCIWKLRELFVVSSCTWSRGLNPSGMVFFRSSGVCLLWDFAWCIGRRTYSNFCPYCRKRNVRCLLPRCTIGSIHRKFLVVGVVCFVASQRWLVNLWFVKRLRHAPMMLVSKL